VRVGRDGVLRLEGHGGNAFRRVVLWRGHDWLRRAIARGAGSRAAVSLALLLGERGTLDRGDRAAFVKLGISHLLALSGQHLGFLAGALVLLMRMLRCRRRAWILLALCLYVGLAGFILSLYRALIMVLILAGAAAIHRPLRPVGSLVSAFFLMLLAFPFALYSVGFQLSFLATLGVLVAFSRLGKPEPGVFNRAWYWTRSSIQLSVAAQVAVVPVLLACFGEVSIVAPLATMVFIAPTVVLLFLAPLAAVVGAVVPAAGSALFALLHHASAAFDVMLEACARIAPRSLEAPPPDPTVYYAGLAILVCSKRASLRLVGLVMLGAAWT
jgi:competence protein ComEC